MKTDGDKSQPPKAGVPQKPKTPIWKRRSKHEEVLKNLSDRIFRRTGKRPEFVHVNTVDEALSRSTNPKEELLGELREVTIGGPIALSDADEYTSERILASIDASIQDIIEGRYTTSSDWLYEEDV